MKQIKKNKIPPPQKKTTPLTQPKKPKNKTKQTKQKQQKIINKNTKTKKKP